MVAERRYDAERWGGPPRRRTRAVVGLAQFVQGSVVLAIHRCVVPALASFALACGGEPSREPPSWDPSTLALYDRSANPFAQPIGADPAVHPDSDLLVTSLEEQFAEQGMLVVVGEWSTPVFVAGADTPRADVALGAEWSPYPRLRGVPFPPWTLPDPEEDGHAAILDLDAGLEYDFFGLDVSGGDPSASWANVVALDGPGIFPYGLSARGSGFALLNGVIWPHELEAGRVEHALLFSYDLTRAGGPVAPATESDGTGSGAHELPEGARVQLDPALDVASLGLPPWLATIAIALQEYGMILGDDGGGISLYAIGPRSFPEGEAVYDGLLPLDGAPYVAFPSDFPVDRFRVIDYGPQDPDASTRARVEMPERFE